MGKNKKGKRLTNHDLIKLAFSVDSKMGEISKAALQKYYDILNCACKGIKLNFYNVPYLRRFGLESCAEEVLYTMFWSDPNNYYKMNEIIKDTYRKHFPDNPNLDFDIDDSYDLDKQMDAFKTMLSMNANSEKYNLGNHYKYVLSQDYINTLIRAPKVGVYHCDSSKHDRCKKSVDIVAMNVNGEIILGEIATVYKAKPRDYDLDDIGGSVFFNIFVKGDVRYPIEIKRDDFMPGGSSHLDKLDENFHLLLNDETPRNTCYSHSHICSNVHQLSFPNKPNQSVNVECMPINNGNMRREKEYCSLSDMEKDSFAILNYDGKMLSSELLESDTIKNVLLERLKDCESISKEGKFLTRSEIDRCIEAYNANIDDVRNKDNVLSIIGDAKSGERNKAKVAQVLRNKYFEIMDRKCTVIKDKKGRVKPAGSIIMQGTAPVQKIRHKPSKEAKVSKEARRRRDAKIDKACDRSEEDYINYGYLDEDLKV